MMVTAIAGEVVLQIGSVRREFHSQIGSNPYTSIEEYGNLFFQGDKFGVHISQNNILHTTDFTP